MADTSIYEPSRNLAGVGDESYTEALPLHAEPTTSKLTHKNLQAERCSRSTRLRRRRELTLRVMAPGESWIGRAKSGSFEV